MQQTTWWIRSALALALILAACDAPPSATPAPTLTLIPATVTPTATPVTPTATRLSLPGPSDLVTATPDGGLVATPTARRALDTLLSADPIAAELVSMAQRRIANDLGLSANRVLVSDITAIEWTDSSLGCPLPGQTYAPVLVVGYRIVLRANGSEYIFHTDTERLFPCDADNEALPE